MPSEPLYHKQLHSQPAAGPGAPPARVAVFVHSLMSSHAMLAPVAQRYIDAAAAATGSPWTAVMLDSRCHGQSAALDLPGPHTVDSMTDDVLRTLSAGFQEGRWGKPDVLVGHSIGGLIVLEAAQRLGAAAATGGPAELAALGVPRQVWVLDSRALPVGPDNPCHAEVAGFMAALTSVPEPMSGPEAEAEAVAAFLKEAAGISPAPDWTHELCTYVVKPSPSGGGYIRQFDPSVLSEMLVSFCAKDYTALLKAPPPGCTLHLVRGTASRFWLADGEEELALWREQQAAGGRLRVHDLEGCTHWVPISHKDELLADMTAALAEL